MDDQIFVAIDVETTGLFCEHDRIIELGGVKFLPDGSVIECFQELINPLCNIHHKAIAVHGITDEMVKDKEPASKILPRFFEFIGNPNNLLLAHNSSFDAGFLAHETGRSNLCWPGHRIIDTLGLSRHKYTSFKNHKLQTLCSCLGISAPNAHRALGDSLCVQKLFMNLQPHFPITVLKSVSVPIYVPTIYQTPVEPSPVE